MLCECRWGDSPLRYVQNKLFLNYTAETRQLDFLSYYHDKVICGHWAVFVCLPLCQCHTWDCPRDHLHSDLFLLAIRR